MPVAYCTQTDENNVDVLIFQLYSSCLEARGDFPHQNQAPPLSLQGSDHAEHREQQAADLHHIHDGQRGAGQQLRREECLKQVTVRILESNRGESSRSDFCLKLVRI